VPFVRPTVPEGGWLLTVRLALNKSIGAQHKMRRREIIVKKLPIIGITVTLLFGLALWQLVHVFKAGN
jgi:hypothetical protein